MIFRRNVIALLTVVVFTVGCFPTLDVTPVEVERQFRVALKPGDSAEVIEQYLHGRGLTGSYDNYQSRYQSIIRHPDSEFHAIVIYIFVDKQKKLIKVEANDSYTFL